MTLLIPNRKGVRVSATGSCLGSRVVTTRELTARPESPLTEEEVIRLTGVVERRWLAPDHATSDLAIAAARQILDRAGVNAVDRLILSTSSPDYPSPATACLVQHALGLAPCAAVDLSAACAGFLFALDWGARAVLTGDDRVLVMAAEARSRALDLHDRATFSLFGDGAGGVLLEPGPEGEGLLGLLVRSDGRGFFSIHVPAGGSRCPASLETVTSGGHAVRMQDGPQVLLQAVEGMTDIAEELLRELGLGLGDIDLVVPHQPNRRIMDRLARQMRIPPAKLFINVATTGNMASASLPVALDEALHKAALAPRSLLLLVGAGAGYSVGAAVIRVPTRSGT